MAWVKTKNQSLVYVRQIYIKENKDQNTWGLYSNNIELSSYLTKSDAQEALSIIEQAISNQDFIATEYFQLPHIQLS